MVILYQFKFGILFHSNILIWYFFNSSFFSRRYKNLYIYYSFSIFAQKKKKNIEHNRVYLTVNVVLFYKFESHTRNSCINNSILKILKYNFCTDCLHLFTDLHTSDVIYLLFPLLNIVARMHLSELYYKPRNIFFLKTSQMTCSEKCCTTIFIMSSYPAEFKAFSMVFHFPVEYWNTYYRMYTLWHISAGSYLRAVKWSR